MRLEVYVIILSLGRLHLTLLGLFLLWIFYFGNYLVDGTSIVNVCHWEYLVVDGHILHLLHVRNHQMDLQRVLALVQVGDGKSVALADRIDSHAYFHFVLK
jgi:hypothetical protein